MTHAQLIAFALTLIVCSSAFAEETVELSETQRGYNEQGVELIRDGDFDAAIGKFQSSLTLGETNITFLNLGRAYQKAGQCKLAKETYAKVANAPSVPAPTRAEIMAVLAKRQTELPAACPVKLTIKCDDPLTEVAMDGANAAACGAELTMETTPGEHSVTATLAGKDFEKMVAAEEGDFIEVVVVFAPDVAETAPSDNTVTEVTPPPEPTGGRVAKIGLPIAIAGGAILATAWIVEGTAVRKAVQACTKPDESDEPCDVDSAETLQRINKGVWLLGGITAAVGTTMVVLGGKKEKRVALTWNGSGPTVSFSTRF